MSIADGLELHLRLDDLGGDARIADSSGRGRDGTVNGAVTPVWDATFGRAARFDGSGGYVSVADPFPDPAAFTITAWVRPDGLRGDGAFHAFLGREGDAHRKPGMWWYDGKLHYDSYDAAGATRFNGVIDGFFPTDDWTHVAWVKDREEYRFYRDATLIQTTPGPAQVFAVPTTDYWIGKVDNHFRGRMAAVRVYGRALSPAELWRVTEDDRVVPFRTSHPIGFELYDENAEHVLYIDDHPAGASHDVHLAIRNTAGRPVFLAPLGVDAPTDGQHHFRLRFRRGVLSEMALRGLTVAGDADWKGSAPQEDAEGASVYLMRTHRDAPWTLEAGAAVALVLRPLCAAAQGGSRGTRVELLTGAVSYDAAGTSPIGATRSQVVNVVNHRGQKTIPLHAGFVGSNAVLNNGSADARGDRGGRGNDLRLRITNTLRRDPDYPERSRIAFAGVGSEAVSTLVLEAETEPDEKPGTVPWALARAGELAPTVTAGPGAWKIESSDLGQSRAWTLQPLEGLVLEAGEWVDVVLSDVVSSLPAGIANLTVRYENVPGYWDGQWVVPVEKSPLHFPAAGGVGVGTAQPHGFHVALPGAPGKDSSPVSPGVLLYGGRDGDATAELRNGGTGTPSLRFAQRLEVEHDARIVLTGPGALRFDGAPAAVVGGKKAPAVAPKVGIGVTPEAALDVNGNILQRGFDFVLGRFDTTRGDTGYSRALVKDGGGRLTVNYASDFKGGVLVNGPAITLKGAVEVANGDQDANGHALTVGNLRLGSHADYAWMQSHGGKPLSINPIGNNVGIGTTSPGGAKLVVSAPAAHLQLRREPGEKAGGNLVFLELFQDVNAALNVYPSIRFHHGQKFWHRIEARSEGLLFKTGDTNSDALSDVHAKTAVVAALKIGGVQVGENELRILQRLAAGSLEFDLYNVVQNEYAYAADYAPYDNDRRRIFTWRKKGQRVSQGRWRITYPS